MRLKCEKREIKQCLPREHFQIVQQNAKKCRENVANLNENLKRWTFLYSERFVVVNDIDYNHKQQQNKEFAAAHIRKKGQKGNYNKTDLPRYVF